jgi:hypothetical protein
MKKLKRIYRKTVKLDYNNWRKHTLPCPEVHPTGKAILPFGLIKG